MPDRCETCGQIGDWCGCPIDFSPLFAEAVQDQGNTPAVLDEDVRHFEWAIDSYRDHDVLATPQDACREYAANVGAENSDRAWILTNYDSWERNPFYHGPAVRHPEDDQDDDQGQTDASDDSVF